VKIIACIDPAGLIRLRKNALVFLNASRFHSANATTNRLTPSDTHTVPCPICLYFMRLPPG
jgi:hypothetical protein